MKIEIWGDFACPFCYMGETTLEKVIEGLKDGENMEIVFKAYELDPKAPVKPVQTMTEHFMSEHKQTEEEAVKQIEHITKMASRVGLDYNLKDAQVCSTFDAHRLMKYAKDNTSPENVVKLNFALFHANFIENKLLSDRKMLKAIGVSIGLDGNDIDAMFESDKYTDAIRQDEAELEEKKFDYIPYMLFDDGQVLQGVISSGALKKTLVQQ